MKSVQRIYLLAIVILITSIMGCGRTITHTIQQPIANTNTTSDKYYLESCECKDEDVKSAVCGELIAQVRYFLLKKSLLDDKSGNKKIDLTITGYRDVSSGARFWGGVFAGTDNLAVSVFVTDIENEKRVADFTVAADDYHGNETTSKTLMVAQEIVRIIAGETK